MAWYVVTVSPRQERRVIADLKEQKIDAWSPHEKRWRHIGQQKSEGAAPLFPGYVFVDLPDSRFDKVRATDGVLGFVHVSFSPAAVEGAWVRLIRRAEALGLFDRTQQPWRIRLAMRRVLREGEAVQIVGDGPDAGQIGTIIRGGTKDRLRVLFGRLVATIDRDRLERVTQPIAA